MEQLNKFILLVLFGGIAFNCYSQSISLTCNIAEIDFSNHLVIETIINNQTDSMIRIEDSFYPNILINGNRCMQLYLVTPQLDSCVELVISASNMQIDDSEIVNKSIYIKPNSSYTFKMNLCDFFDLNNILTAPKYKGFFIVLRVNTIGADKIDTKLLSSDIFEASFSLKYFRKLPINQNKLNCLE